MKWYEFGTAHDRVQFSGCHTILIRTYASTNGYCKCIHIHLQKCISENSSIILGVFRTDVQSVATMRRVRFRRSCSGWLNQAGGVGEKEERYCKSGLSSHNRFFSLSVSFSKVPKWYARANNVARRRKGEVQAPLKRKPSDAS